MFYTHSCDHPGEPKVDVLQRAFDAPRDLELPSLYKTCIKISLEKTRFMLPNIREPVI
ncbi:Uncharacterized protein APZ42_023574 [Daphnia magna]|uniref:Uncharacterized protein n=1 Tax=Daphnia magna TaxID=35525 RepID=A0A164URH3_9CRUS|nr:Uncharacterized protein APZ42_023574 [Daphnia magna]